MTVLNGILSPLKLILLSIENIIVTDGIMTLHAPPRCYATCGHTIFMTVMSYDIMNYVCIHSKRWQTI